MCLLITKEPKGVRACVRACVCVWCVCVCVCVCLSIDRIDVWQHTKTCKYIGHTSACNHAYIYPHDRIYITHCVCVCVCVRAYTYFLPNCSNIWTRRHPRKREHMRIHTRDIIGGAAAHNGGAASNPGRAHTLAMVATGAVFHLLMSALKTYAFSNICEPTTRRSTAARSAGHVHAQTHAHTCARTRVYMRTHARTRAHTCGCMFGPRYMYL